jgi:DNA-binding response OmpR family regulator
MDGHEVTLAHDGESAYERFLNFHPEIALLDIGMPRLSGYELAKRIRAQREVTRLLAPDGELRGTDQIVLVRLAHFETQDNPQQQDLPA